MDKKAKKSPGSITLSARVWVMPKDGRIRIQVKDEFITTVAGTAGKRAHPHLYGKLRAALKRRDKWLEV